MNSYSFNWLSNRVVQPVVSCIQTFTRLSNPFDNTLYRVNGALLQSKTNCPKQWHTKRLINNDIQLRKLCRKNIITMQRHPCNVTHDVFSHSYENQFLDHYLNVDHVNKVHPRIQSSRRKPVLIVELARKPKMQVKLYEATVYTNHFSGPGKSISPVFVCL